MPAELIITETGSRYYWLEKDTEQPWNTPPDNDLMISKLCLMKYYTRKGWWDKNPHLLAETVLCRCHGYCLHSYRLCGPPGGQPDALRWWPAVGHIMAGQDVVWWCASNTDTHQQGRPGVRYMLCVTDAG